MPNAADVANENAVKYGELKDEHIVDIAKNIELFVKSEEYWDKFAHHSKVSKGHRTFQTRRLVKPIVKASDVSPRAEFVAPRPTKIVVETFEKTINNYGDKAIYSREDLQYHFDNTVNNITDVLKEIAVQKLNFIKGNAFLSSKCFITAEQVSGSDNMLETLKKAAVILRKNGAKRWDGTHYLCHCTPEEKNKLVAELEAKGLSLSEKVKVTINGRPYDLSAYGDWIFSDTIDPQMYKNSTTQYLVLMGKRGIDGQSPVDVAKLEGESGIELLNKGLGHGVLIDEDGNYTSDDNNQQGAVAINMDGLGAAVSDDLCILDCEFTVNEVAKTALADSDRTGFVSKSPDDIEIAGTLTTGVEMTFGGATHDSTANKDYVSRSTIIKATIKAATGKTLGTPDADDWSITDASGTAYAGAKIIAFADSYKTAIIEVGQYCKAFKVKCDTTAS